MRSRYNIIAILMAMFFVSACSSGIERVDAPSTLSDKVRGERYLYHLSHAQLLLAQASDRQKVIEKHRRHINDLAHGANKKEATSFAAIILDLTLDKSDTRHRLVVPVRVTDSAKFHSLDKILRDLPPHFTFHGIKSLNVPIPMSVLTKVDEKEMGTQLDAIKTNLISRSFPLTIDAQAQLHMHLTKFFLAKRMRDAAYISLENAKHAIASMVEQSPDKAELLSKKSKELENRLNQQLPYKL